ncbi:MAG: hypothetical protein HC927_03360 [Deltaproteobacteria bacterium]|nr:hypothetical protein [Deltaproteobacteria bacterium]
MEVQDLIELHYFENLSSRQIAELFQVEEPTIRSRLRAALSHLRQAYHRSEANGVPIPESDELLTEQLRELARELRRASA